MKNTIITILALLVVGLGFYYFTKNSSLSNKKSIDDANLAKNSQATTTAQTKLKDASDDAVKVLGKSVQGKDIIAFSYGTGDKNILVIGGIHGGYSWNTSLTAYELMAYFRTNPGLVPQNIKVTIIPVMNPDGLGKVVPNAARFNSEVVNPSQALQVEGRFNANKVDLSRNFDCNWQPNAKWQTKDVSGGTAVFSEPESIALKNYVEANKPSAVVVLYSSAGGVYASSCGGTVSALTASITDLYANASGYLGHSSFDYYETSGDLPNWLAKIGVPAISVLLTDHIGTDFEKNRKGVEALIQNFAK